MQRGTQTQVLPKQGTQAIGVSHVFNGAIPSASASSAPAATATATTVIPFQIYYYYFQPLGSVSNKYCRKLETGVSLLATYDAK
jgi:hypothetical protein